MRALIVGLGSIGRRHLSNLKLIEPSIKITVWRHQRSIQPADGALVEAEHIVYALEDALEARPDFALITGPASTHIPTALALAQQNIHLFIEKPLSNTLSGVDDLLLLCGQNKLTLMVGYSLRFMPSLQVMKKALDNGQIGEPLILHAEVGQHLSTWRPGTDYRQGVSASQALGGGAVLELSHEIDYARWLLGEVRSVSAVVAHLSDLEMDVEDTAEITLHFAEGGIGQLHLDMVQHSPSRMCRIIGSRGTLLWNGIANLTRIYSPATSQWSELYNAPGADRNDMYLTEISHFIDCIRTKTSPLIDGADGKSALVIALAAKQASETGCSISL